MGFDNLKVAVDPMSEEYEKALLCLILEELSNLYPLHLCSDKCCGSGPNWTGSDL
jgi:hypothetical protein